MYQNRLGPSGGIYYPNFVPCFVVLYLNTGKTRQQQNKPIEHTVVRVCVRAHSVHQIGFDRFKFRFISKKMLFELFLRIIIDKSFKMICNV